MSAPSICAVIITFHPDLRMIDHLGDVLAQTQALVVVDNGSNPQALEALRAASSLQHFHLVENAENLGIAEALNQGVRWARDQGYPWVLLLDQDSQLTDGFVSALYATWQAHPNRERVVSTNPSYVNPDTGVEPYVLRAEDGGPVCTMTSGSLMPTWIFDKLGLFRTEYFIDHVDTEYCLRCRAAGYLIADSRAAVLLHKPGHPKRMTIAGFTFEPTNHSALRRYYFTRNRIVVFRKFFFRFPRWVTHMIYWSLRETIKCFIGEQDRKRKLRNTFLGAWDGLLGRMGRRDSL